MVLGVHSVEPAAAAAAGATAAPSLPGPTGGSSDEAGGAEAEGSDALARTSASECWNGALPTKHLRTC